PRAVASGPAAPRGSQVLVRSVRPQPAATTRRARVESFGLTDKDLERIRALPQVSAVVPVRSFPAEARRLERMHPGQVIATLPGYQELAGLRVAAGRFLEDEDGLEMKNVAVLGAAAAERLFPEEEGVGKTVRLGSFFYVVVGVLREQSSPAG